MTADKKYSIDLIRLREGTHHYSFEVDDAFFAGFPEPFVANADVKIGVELTKSTHLLDLRLHFQGAVELHCDRCLLPYTQPLDVHCRLIYSFDTSLKEVEDAIDVVYMARETPTLNLAQDFYDFISLEVPLRKVPDDCPGPRCPPEVLALLKQSDEINGIATDNKGIVLNEVPVDSIWSALRKLNE